MKKMILSSLSLFALVSNTAMAEGDAPPSAAESSVPSAAALSEEAGQKVALAPTKSDLGTTLSSSDIDRIKKELTQKPVDENSVNVYGLLQGNVNTSDTQRNNTPDFTSAKARAGVLVKGGIASGQIEVQFLGNQPADNSSVNDGVALRQAQLNLDFLTIKTPEATLVSKFSVGGVRVGGANATAPDAANTPSGYARQDGIYLQENATFGKKATASVGLGVFNNLFTVYSGVTPGSNAATIDGASTYAGWGNSGASLQSYATMNSAGTSKAYLLSASGTYNLDEHKNLNAGIYYGFQHEAPVTTDGSGANVTSTRNDSHTEAFALYNDTALFGDKGVISGNGVSVWYENEFNGDTRTSVVSNDNLNASLYGLGFAGDTARYMTGMLQKGDRFTYSAAYAVVQAVFDDSTYSPNYTENQISAGVGYAVNTFELALTGEYSTATGNLYADNQGNSGKNSNEMKTYLTAIYLF